MHTFLGQHMKDKHADMVMMLLSPIMADRDECLTLLQWIKLMYGRQP